MELIQTVEVNKATACLMKWIQKIEKKEEG